MSDKFTDSMMTLLNMKPAKPQPKQQLYRAHWHEIATGRGHMSAPYLLTDTALSDIVISVKEDKTVKYDGIKKA